MNASLFTADRNTHIKIVVIALIAAIAIAGIAIKMNAAKIDLGSATPAASEMAPHRAS